MGKRSLSRVSEKYTVKDYISNTKLQNGDHYKILHPNTEQGSFFPLKSYSMKTLRKNVARKYKRDVLMPPGHPIIVLKSNKFNKAGISVKRSIGQ